MMVSFVYTPYEVNTMDISSRFLSPSLTHLLGTDNFGRDILSRIMAGTQTTFSIGTVTVLIGLTLGTLIGAFAGFLGGWVDEIIMRIIDTLMAFPKILLAIVIIAVFGTGRLNTMLALGIMFIPFFARISRSGFIQFKEFEFVTWARALGAGPLRIMFVHILPNVIQPLIVAASISFASAILTESELSYLGLGVQPPDPSLGRMLSESQNYLLKSPYYTISTGLVIMLAVLGFNFIGDGLGKMRDIRRSKS